MERTSKKQTRRTTVTNRENSEMENLQGKVENLRLDWLKIVSENGRVGFEQLQKPHHLIIIVVVVAAITSTPQLELDFALYFQKGISSDNPEHAFILWLIKIAVVTFTVHAVMTDYLLREFFFSLFIEISSRILFPCISSRWSKCLYILYYFYLSLTTHPIELEGVHILTKAHERAPVCW
jgi:hypothetical protein